MPFCSPPTLRTNKLYGILMLLSHKNFNGNDYNNLGSYFELAIWPCTLETMRSVLSTPLGCCKVYGDNGCETVWYAILIEGVVVHICINFIFIPPFQK